jgi:DNA-binding response OmpR family regulator
MKEIKILIIEDDKMIAEAVSDIVETLGYRPIWATAGPEALEKASQEEYDLAILDLELPRMPGIEVAEKLMIVNKGLRILFTTGTSDQEELIETSNTRIAGIIHKPFEMADLQSAIEKALRRT